MFDDETGEVFDEDTQKERRSGYLLGVILRLLKWLGIAVVGIIFVVTVVIVTLNIVDRNRARSQTRIPTTQEYLAQPPILEWYDMVGEVRGSSADEVRKTFIVTPHIGYDIDDRMVQTELIARTIQIREIIAFYFSSKTGDDLLGIENRQRVKADLTRDINRIMSSGKIRDVAFDRYQIVDF